MSERTDAGKMMRCNWERDPDWDDAWSTECGEDLMLSEGRTPADYRMKFCCFCGEEISAPRTDSMEQEASDK